MQFDILVLPDEHKARKRLTRHPQPHLRLDAMRLCGAPLCCARSAVLASGWLRTCYWQSVSAMVLRLVLRTTVAHPTAVQITIRSSAVQLLVYLVDASGIIFFFL